MVSKKEDETRTEAPIGSAPVGAAGGAKAACTICIILCHDCPCTHITVFMWLNLPEYWEGIREDHTMCVAVPAEVLEIRDGNIGLVDFGELQQEVRLDLVDVQVGEFVLVHVGFAIQRLSREEGLETREVFRQVYAAMES